MFKILGAKYRRKTYTSILVLLFRSEEDLVLLVMPKFDINDLKFLFQCYILIPRKCLRKTPFKAQCPPPPDFETFLWPCLKDAGTVVLRLGLPPPLLFRFSDPPSGAQLSSFFFSIVVIF